MLRTSSYTIYVDLPDNPREMLLVHGYTGAYDKVSRRVANYLRANEAKRAPNPLYGEWSSEPETPADSEQPSDEVLAILKQRGYLTTLTADGEEEFFGRFAARLHKRSSQRVPSYIFMPSYDCNLRCSYCFQDHMRSDTGFRHLLHTMQPKMVDRLYSVMPEIETMHGLDPAAVQRRNIGLFGGEPLLAAHLDIVTYIIEAGLDLGETDFWAITNATELEAYRDVLGQGKLSRLQVTLDGPSREHDQRRIYADGSPTFERIATNVSMALELGTSISIRLNIDRGNIGDLPELVDEIMALGWHENRNFSIYTAPISAVNDATDRKTTMNSWQLDQALTEMRQEHPKTLIIGRPDETIRLRARQIFEGREEVIPQLRPSFCGAHDQMYIFDAFADVYACWEKTGDPQIRIAHVTAEGHLELTYEVNREWRSRSVASNPVCRRCRYALHCGGGCAILALGQRGKFHANYCDGFASRFRASIADAHRAHCAGEEATSLHERVCDL